MLVDVVKEGAHVHVLPLVAEAGRVLAAGRVAEALAAGEDRGDVEGGDDVGPVEVGRLRGLAPAVEPVVGVRRVVVDAPLEGL